MGYTGIFQSMLITPIRTALAKNKKEMEKKKQTNKQRIQNGHQWGLESFMSFFKIHFLANSMLLDGIHAKEFIFKVLLNFNHSFLQISQFP